MIRLILIISIIFLTSGICSADESWNGFNGGGSRRNYSTVSPGSPLAIAWQRGYEAFPSSSIDYFNSGKTCSGPLVRDGKVWMLTNTARPHVAIYSLTDGKEIGGYDLPTLPCTVARTNAGIADTDLPSGAFWAFGPQNSLIIVAGGDWAGKLIVDADTGATITWPSIKESKLGYGPNAMATFACSPDSPFLHIGGNFGHSIYGGSALYRTDHWSGGYSFYSFKGWNGLVQGNMGYDFGPMGRGLRILASRALPLPSNPSVRLHSCYEAANHVLYSYGQTNGFSACRPICLLPNGNIAYLAHEEIGGEAYSKGSLIAVVNPKPTAAKGSIPGAFDYNLMAREFQLDIPTLIGNDYSYPQIMASDANVIAFFPEQNINFIYPFIKTPAKLVCVDVAGKKVAWISSLPMGHFKTQCERNRNNQPLFAAVQAKLCGDSIYLFEPRIESRLLLRITRVPLATGKPELSQDFGLLDSTGSAITKVSLAMLRDVAATDSVLTATDSVLTALVQYTTSPEQKAPTNQVLCVLRGAIPQPPIVHPVAPTPEQRVLEFAKPILDSIKYDAIERILR